LKVDSLVKDYQDEINKLDEGGSVFLSNLINDTHLIEIGWMVIEGYDGAGPSKLINSQAIISPSSFSSDDNKRKRREEYEGDDEDVDIIGDLDAAREEDERLEGESDPRGAHPDPYLFTWHFKAFLILIFNNCTDDLIKCSEMIQLQRTAWATQ